MGADVKMPYKKLGAWLAHANNTVYQATTDGFVQAWNDTGNILNLFIDDFTPPATSRSVSNGVARSGIEGPVKKNDYWKTNTATLVYWIPLEP